MAQQPGPPDAPRVVLVHGSLDRSAAFARVARDLPELTTIRYDRRGYGRSLSAGPSIRFDAQVDDLEGIVGDEPAIVAGHSLGGVVALAFAARHRDLAPAVVAYEAPMPWLEWWPSNTAGGSALADGDPGDAAERFMRRIVGDEVWASLPDRTRAQRRAEGPALVAELASLRPPHPAPYAPEALTMPVVAAHGSRSRPHHQQSARMLAAAAPRGELHVVEGADHGVHLTHPGGMAALVRRAAELARAQLG